VKPDIGKLLARVGQCLFILVILAFAIWRITLEFRIKSRLNAIAARGEPVTLAELKRSYDAHRAQENAALLWLDGFEQLVPQVRPGYEPWSRLTLPERNAHASEDLLKSSNGFLESNRLAVATFRRAASKQKTRFVFDLATDPWVSHLAHLRAAAKLLRLEALVAAESGDGERAVSAILTILSAARTLESSPTFEGLAMRFGIDWIAAKATERLLNCATLTDTQLQALSSAFGHIEHADNLWRSLMGDRAVLLSRLTDTQQFLAWMEEPEIDNALASSMAEILGLLSREVPFAADTFERLLRVSRLPDPDRFLAREEWDKAEDRAKEHYYIFTGVFLHSFYRCVERDCAHRAQGRIVQTVLGIERFRLEHGGELPLNVPAVPDPFDGQPLRFRPTPVGYVVYSVGPDARDDGGADRPLWKLKKGDEPAPVDITFFVERQNSF
jgi:hypothetical protein